MEKIFIGIDHGFWSTKTQNHVFKSSIKSSDSDFMSDEDVLEYDGVLYTLSEDGNVSTDDKTKNDDFFIITLIAVAKEIESRGCSKMCNVNLAVGLPIADYRRKGYKEKFAEYLKRDSMNISYKFNKQRYVIRFLNVGVYPQAFAGISTLLADKSSVFNTDALVYLCDIGGGTSDIMTVTKGRPDMDSGTSIDIGMRLVIQNIIDHIRSDFGKTLNPAQIEKVIAFDGTNGFKDLKIEPAIKEYAKQELRKIFDALREKRYDISTTPIVFMGGGAQVLSNLLADEINNDVDIQKALMITDVKANVKGYEAIHEIKVENGEY